MHDSTCNQLQPTVVLRKAIKTWGVKNDSQLSN